MAMQEQDSDLHEELEQEGEFAEEERIPDTGKKPAPGSTKGTPVWRQIEDYQDRKRLEDELEDLEELDIDFDDTDD